ncbi:hypothetical protein OUZ56_023797 [Daphnia magna]|uniref:Uncharacterized protein n=1 Tax=Daphnia magna TaxID=35525 RepID=A0ABR0AZW5_9CRUS|nr:hypothetical protein OUZ56_023797 [Daphnia magna]
MYHTSLSSLSLSGTASMNPASLDLADDNSSFEIDSQSSGKKLTAMMIYVVHLSIQKRIAICPKSEKRLKTLVKPENSSNEPRSGSSPDRHSSNADSGNDLYRNANYSPFGLRISLSSLERTSPDHCLFTTMAALSKERMTHLCE